jgi:hypothetical protein
VRPQRQNYQAAATEKSMGRGRRLPSRGLCGNTNVLRSLISLEDDQIDLVLYTVKKWCDDNRVEINSAEGNRAINVAVNLISSNGAHDLLSEMKQRLSPE